MEQQAALVERIFGLEAPSTNARDEILFFSSNGPGIVAETWDYITDGAELTFERRAPRSVREWWCAEGGLHNALVGRTPAPSANTGARQIFHGRSASQDRGQEWGRSVSTPPRRFEGEPAPKLLLANRRELSNAEPGRGRDTTQSRSTSESIASSTTIVPRPDLAVDVASSQRIPTPDPAPLPVGKITDTAKPEVTIMPKVKFTSAFTERLAAEIKASQEAQARAKLATQKFESEFTRRLQREIEESQAQAAILFDLQESLNVFFASTSVIDSGGGFEVRPTADPTTPLKSALGRTSVPSPITVPNKKISSAAPTPMTPSRACLVSLQRHLDDFFASVPPSLAPVGLVSRTIPTTPSTVAPLPSPAQVAKVRAAGLSIDVPKAYRDATTPRTAAMIRSARQFVNGSPRPGTPLTATMTPTSRSGREMVRKLQEDLNTFFSRLEMTSPIVSGTPSSNSLLLQVQRDLDEFFTSAAVVQTPLKVSFEDTPGDNAILVDLQRSLDKFFTAMPVTSSTPPMTPYTAASLTALKEVQTQLNDFFSTSILTPEMTVTGDNTLGLADMAIAQIQAQLDKFFSDIRQEITSEDTTVQQETEEVIKDVNTRVGLLVDDIHSSLTMKFEDDPDAIIVQVDEDRGKETMVALSAAINTFTSQAQAAELAQAQSKGLVVGPSSNGETRRHTPLDIDIPDDIRDMLSGGGKPQRSPRNQSLSGSEKRLGSPNGRNSVSSSILSAGERVASPGLKSLSAAAVTTPPPPPPLAKATVGFAAKDSSGQSIEAQTAKGQAGDATAPGRTSRRVSRRVSRRASRPAGSGIPSSGANGAVGHLENWNEADEDAYGDGEYYDEYYTDEEYEDDDELYEGQEHVMPEEIVKF